MRVSLADMADRERVVMTKEQIELMLGDVDVTVTCTAGRAAVSYEVEVPSFIEVEEVLGSFPVAAATDPELLQEDMDRQRRFPTHMASWVQPVPLLDREEER